MKTFYETFRDKIDRTDNSVVLFEGEYKAIQKDAEQSGFERGLREAAEIVNPKGTRVATVEVIKLKEQILTLLDKPKAT